MVPQKSIGFSFYAVILHNITISMEYPKSCFWFIKIYKIGAATVLSL